MEKTLIMRAANEGPILNVHNNEGPDLNWSNNEGPNMISMEILTTLQTSIL